MLRTRKTPSPQGESWQSAWLHLLRHHPGRSETRGSHSRGFLAFTIQLDSWGPHQDGPGHSRPCVAPYRPGLTSEASRMPWKGKTQVQDRSSLRPLAGTARATSYRRSEPFAEPISGGTEAPRAAASTALPGPQQAHRGSRGPPAAEGSVMPSGSALRASPSWSPLLPAGWRGPGVLADVDLMWSL